MRYFQLASKTIQQLNRNVITAGAIKALSTIPTYRTVGNKEHLLSSKLQASGKWKVNALVAGLATAAFGTTVAFADEEKKIITKITPGETIKHSGTLHINCNVPEKVSIEVTDGDLIIYGDVGESTQIKLLVTPQNLSSSQISSHGFFSFGKNSSVVVKEIKISGNSSVSIKINGSDKILGNSSKSMMIINDQQYDMRYKLQINGTTHRAVDIYAMGDIICKKIMNNCTVKSESSISAGDIGASSTISSSNGALTLGDIMERVRIQTKNGSISLGHIMKQVLVSTTNGRVTAGNIKAGSTIRSTNGSIEVLNIDDDVSISTTNGSVQAGKVSSLASISTTNGSIRVSAGDESSLSAVNGLIYIGGRRSRPKFGR